MIANAESILERLIRKIKAAPIDPKPTDNIYMEDLFDSEVYQSIVTCLPHLQAYTGLSHPDAMRPDGTTARLAFDLTDDTLDRVQFEHRDFWRMMKDILSSDVLQQTILRKFETKIRERFGDQHPDLISIPLFLRDSPGYRIGIHPDASSKVITMQFYLPPDESQIHLGTSFHIKEENGFRLHKTNAFKPNSAYAFVRTDSSWHSVSKMEANEAERNTLALIIYIKGQQYRSNDAYV